MAYTKYSLTPDNNNSAPPDGAPEGMLPSGVNNTMRDMMAQIRDVGDGIRDGTYAITNANITGGSISGITDLAVADGGTGASNASGARTNLGASTIGSNLFVLTNPSAVTFPRFNADNTVSALSASDFRTAIGAGTGNGTVTSVTGTSPVASSGGTTPAISLSSGYGDTQNPYASKTANFFLAAPNGTAGVPTFRSIVAADIPTLNQNTTGTASNVTGTVAIANGGTGATDAATARSNLGLAIGTNVQAYDAELAAIAALAPTADNFIVGNGTTWILETPAQARTSLGATTLGGNLLTITNPSAVTFPRFNADNTVSSLSAADFRTAIGAGTGNGSVTSVALSGGTTGLTVSGSPITSSGTITLAGTLAATNGGTGQSTYTVGDLLVGGATNTLTKLAGVATGNALISGGVGAAPSYGKIGLTTHVSGTLPVANGGTGITSFGAGVATWLGTPSSANLASAVTDETGSGSLVFATTPTITAMRQTRVAVAASDINLNSGSYFTRTISGTTTFTVSNVPASGTAISFILDLTNGGSATVNWWSNVKWAGGTAPTLTSSGRDVLGFYTHDAGTNWNGLVLAKDIK